MRCRGGPAGTALTARWRRRGPARRPSWPKRAPVLPKQGQERGWAGQGRVGVVTLERGLSVAPASFDPLTEAKNAQVDTPGILYCSVACVRDLPAHARVAKFAAMHALVVLVSLTALQVHLVLSVAPPQQPQRAAVAAAALAAPRFAAAAPPQNQTHSQGQHGAVAQWRQLDPCALSRGQEPSMELTVEEVGGAGGPIRGRGGAARGTEPFLREGGLGAAAAVARRRPARARGRGHAAPSTRGHAPVPAADTPAGRVHGLEPRAGEGLRRSAARGRERQRRGRRRRRRRRRPRAGGLVPLRSAAERRAAAAPGGAGAQPLGGGAGGARGRGRGWIRQARRRRRRRVLRRIADASGVFQTDDAARLVLWVRPRPPKIRQTHPGAVFEPRRGV
jgi:hypothetical protein